MHYPHLWQQPTTSKYCQLLKISNNLIVLVNRYLINYSFKYFWKPFAKVPFSNHYCLRGERSSTAAFIPHDSLQEWGLNGSAMRLVRSGDVRTKIMIIGGQFACVRVFHEWRLGAAPAPRLADVNQPASLMQLAFRYRNLLITLNVYRIKS